MSKKLLTMIVISTAIGFGSVSIARADCESDLTLLEKAMSTPNLKPEAKATLDAAGAAGAAAMKKDDDATCNKAVMEGLAKAGVAAPAASTAAASTVPIGDLSPLKTMAADALKIVKTGDFAAAKAKIKEIEMAWDKSAKALKAANLDKWNVIDRALDTAFRSVRASAPTAAASTAALEDVIRAIEKA